MSTELGLDFLFLDYDRAPRLRTYSDHPPRVRESYTASDLDAMWNDLHRRAGTAVGILLSPPIVTGAV